MLCDLILPFLFLPICQTDESLAGYAERGVPYRLVEMQGEPANLEVVLGFPGRKQFTVETPCAVLTGRVSVPLPWFDVTGVEANPTECDQPEATDAFLDSFQAATLAELAGGTILLSDDNGPVLVFQRQD